MDHADNSETQISTIDVQAVDAEQQPRRALGALDPYLCAERAATVPAPARRGISGGSSAASRVGLYRHLSPVARLKGAKLLSDLVSHVDDNDLPVD